MNWNRVLWVLLTALVAFNGLLGLYLAISQDWAPATFDMVSAIFFLLLRNSLDLEEEK